MTDPPRSDPNPMTEAEKLAAQAETGGGRTMARPAGTREVASGLQPSSASPNNAPLGGDMGALGASGGNTGGAGSLSGNVTNDDMPGGGATGDKAQPDTIEPGSR